METPTLIFCGGGNERFASIAIENGFKYGCRFPSHKPYAHVWFADQDWRNPNRTAYMSALAKHRPVMATVIDWEQEEQLSIVLDWAEEAAQHVEQLLIVPKVMNGVEKLPRIIGDKPVVLAYSVPTNHGGTSLPAWQFANWPVHLLGGSPGAQMRLARYMDVRSADGNMAMKMANRGLYWMGKNNLSNRWVSIKETDGKRWDGDGNYEAFGRSCQNTMRAWRKE